MRPWITRVESTVALPGPRAWLDKMDYRLCESIGQLEDYVGPAIARGDHIGVDWETTSLNVWVARPVGLSVSTADGSGLYAPVGHQVDLQYNLPEHKVLAVLQAIDAAGAYSSPPGPRQCWFNFAYDSAIMRRVYGWEPSQGHWEDAMLDAHLFDCTQLQYGLKFTVARLFGVEMLEYTDLVEGGGGFERVPVLEAPPYACADADFARRLVLHPHVQRMVRAQEYIRRLEHLITVPIREGINDGVLIDVAVVRALREQVADTLSTLVPSIRAQLGVPATFNLRARAQLGQRLVELGVPIEERTGKSKQVATGKEIFQKYAAAHPVLADLIKWTELDTQDRNYLAKLEAAVDHFGSRVRFKFQQIGAPTGRMSSGGAGKGRDAFTTGYVDLNIQSIPDADRKPYLPDMRQAVVANPPDEDTDDWVIVSIDYSQIEIRVAANLSGEPYWIAAFQRGEDIHAANARAAYNDPTITSKKHPRRGIGKIMNFAVLYQATAATVAEHGGLTEAEAQTLIDNFYARLPRLRRWIDATIAHAVSHKVVRTFFGRIRSLEEFFAPDAPKRLREKGKREAVNNACQGGAADLFKTAIFLVWKLVNERGWRADCQVILWMHDELVCRVRRSKLQEIVPAVIQAMEFAVKGWEVPLKAEAEVGWSWSPMMAYEEWVVARPTGEPLVCWWPRRAQTQEREVA